MSSLLMPKIKMSLISLANIVLVPVVLVVDIMLPLLLSMMINALVTLRIEFFWQSVASGVVIILSVAIYTWLQKKDRDGSGGLQSALANPDTRKIAMLIGGLVAAFIILLGLGLLFASPPAQT